ncbi:MAG: DUF1800 family protein [Burkholderiaceae bacterium]|nr:DUF1800 family protein [Burkholderiaceae bacterium]
MARHPSWCWNALATAALATLLTGCGGGSDEPDGTAVATSSDPSAEALAETAAYRRSGSMRAQAVAAPVVPVLTVRARASLAADVGPIMQVRVDDTLIGTVEVRNLADWADYRFTAPTLQPGSKVEVVYTNDAKIGSEDRNLFVALLGAGSTVLLPTTPIAMIDQGVGAKAFDGLNLIAGRSEMYGSGALRTIWPATPGVSDALRLRRQDASRFLLQTTFGPTPATIEALTAKTYAAWIDEQMALPVTDSFVNAVQARYDLGADYRPGGRQYSPYEVSRAFWRVSFDAPDPLRRRVAYALHQIFMVSQADGSLWNHSRAYARYLDLINRHAFGNFRELLEHMALSPAMGLYLSHLRNQKEDLAKGRMPDENFAREIMQLFTIGLYELNPDGSQKLGADGRPIETYGNADVMAMAKVFTGYAWGFPDSALTDKTFRSNPSYAPATDTRVDLQPMKAYPGQHSTAEKVLFAGKPWAVTLPAGASAADDLRSALDTLFRHPNVGPFIGRQLIQKLVTSQPSPAYVARIAAVFADNGRGVRGDLGAVVRAILLDPEARGEPGPGFGKLREPTLRIAQWRRAFDARSVSGEYNFTWQTSTSGQRVFHAPSVFGDFRPGYIPPNSSFAARGATAPEFQIADEISAAGWVNAAEAMGSGGLGWSNGTREVAADYSALTQRLMAGDVAGLLDDIDHLLFGSTMSPELRGLIVEAMSSVGGNSPESQLNRARMAVFIAMASPEYLVQR